MTAVSGRELPRLRVVDSAEVPIDEGGQTEEVSRGIFDRAREIGSAVVGETMGAVRGVFGKVLKGGVAVVAEGLELGFGVTDLVLNPILDIDVPRGVASRGYGKLDDLLAEINEKYISRYELPSGLEAWIGRRLAEIMGPIEGYLGVLRIEMADAVEELEVIRNPKAGDEAEEEGTGRKGRNFSELDAVVVQHHIRYLGDKITRIGARVRGYKQRFAQLSQQIKDWREHGTPPVAQWQRRWRSTPDRRGY